jgi:DNA repair protein SbcC/Rad50
MEDEKRHFEKLKNEKQKKQRKVDESTTERDKLQNMLEPNSRILETLQKNDEKLRIAEETVKSCNSQIQTALSQIHSLLPADEYVTIEKKTSVEINLHLESLRSSLLAKQGLEKSLNDTQRENLGQVSTTKSEIDSANEERKTNLNQISTIQNYLEGKGEQPKIQCDKCGSLLTKQQWNGHIQETRKSIEDLDARIVKLTKRLEAENQKVSTADEKLSEIRTRTRNIETSILLVQQIASQRQRSEAATTSIKPLLDQRTSLMTELRQLLKAEPTLEDQEVVKQASLVQEKLKLIAGEIFNLTRDLQSYDENYLKPQEKRVREAEEAKKQLEKLEPEIRLDESKISLLQTIRTSLRQIQPVVRRNFVSRITQSANDYLKRLYDGAEIENFELTEDYQFIVTRAGHKRHASRLSGGQQVLASMAFLLALSEVLSQLDFLILDEPTTHLDENRRKELVTVLENLRRVPQLIIVDHHPELLEAADTRFRVSLTPNGLSKLDLIEA